MKAQATINYCKAGHSYIHQFYFENEGEYNYEFHKFLTEVSPYSIKSIETEAAQVAMIDNDRAELKWASAEEFEDYFFSNKAQALKFYRNLHNALILAKVSEKNPLTGQYKVSVLTIGNERLHNSTQNIFLKVMSR